MRYLHEVSLEFQDCGESWSRCTILVIKGNEYSFHPEVMPTADLPAKYDGSFDGMIFVSWDIARHWPESQPPCAD